MSLSGFSAGGNLAFTVPLRLQTYMSTISVRQGNIFQLPRIVAIIAWYPNVDNWLTRAQRRATNPKLSKNLSSHLRSLSDAFYFPIAASVESAYALPPAATDEDLTMALPDDTTLCLCEWDMMLTRMQGLRG